MLTLVLLQNLIFPEALFDHQATILLHVV